VTARYGERKWGAQQEKKKQYKGDDLEIAHCGEEKISMYGIGGSGPQKKKKRRSHRGDENFSGSGGGKGGKRSQKKKKRSKREGHVDLRRSHREST